MKEPSATEFAAGSAAAEAPGRASRAADAPPNKAQAPAPPAASRSEGFARWRVPLMIGGVAVVVLAAAYAYFTGGRYEATDDAYVHAAGVDVSANLAGRVIEVDVKENQKVRKGDVLFRLDPAPYDIAIEQAQAQVADAEQQLGSDIATYRQRLGEVKNAQDNAAYAERERKREQGLLAAGAVSQSEYDQAARQADAAKLNVATVQQQQAQALATLGGRADLSVDSHASIRQANAAVARARLNKSWTVIHAPQDGRVTKVEQLQVGDYINASAPVFHLVTGSAWIDANFKENQLKHMRAGQPASVKIDAYPSYKCQGRVDSISPSTDQMFSMLPAENASGNWVKVVQRLPVRLSFACNPAMDPPAGLSANVKVDTGYRRRLFGADGPAR